MALSSINTNIAAYSAQRNIGNASDSANTSIARLSSGNKIAKASDDVAALATGTSLRTSVTTLRQAMLNTAQGSSLLQIADGALGQVVDILQRQKAIAVQAGSGSLSNTDRAFLNQEFQALAEEINRIAGSTKFSSVTLLDGTLSGSKAIVSNSSVGTSTSGATAANVFAFTGAPANGSTIVVNGVTITFTTSAVGSADAAGKVSVGATTADTASNLVRFLNSSSDARFANLTFDNGGTVPTANVTARWSGGLLSGAYVVDASLGTAANITLGTAANRTIAVTNPTNGLGVDRVKATGEVTGTLLVTGNTTAALSGSAIATNLIEDNPDFIGKLGEGKMGKITGTFLSAQNVTFQLRVGDLTYTSVAQAGPPVGVTDIVDATVRNIHFIGSDQFGVAAGGAFTMNIAGGVLAAADVGGQGDVDSIVAQINESLAGVTFTQNRDITSFQEGATVLVGGTEVANFNNMSVNFRSDNFTAVNIEDIQVEAPPVGSSDAKITVQVNGETYVSYSGINNQIAINTSLVLLNAADPNKALTLHTGTVAIAGSATTALDISTQPKAEAIEQALREAFGIDAGSAKLTFQVGNTSAESLGVQIKSVKTDNIYANQALTVATQNDAATAGNALDAAINLVTSIRADVGALQSRFDFAADNLQVTVQNQDAARGILLDTDVTTESTAYATAQVQLQAGIAVLAQANLLPQNLLKLLS
jgi:flagellin